MLNNGAPFGFLGASIKLRVGIWLRQGSFGRHLQLGATKCKILTNWSFRGMLNGSTNTAYAIASSRYSLDALPRSDMRHMPGRTHPGRTLPACHKCRICVFFRRRPRKSGPGIPTKRTFVQCRPRAPPVLSLRPLRNESFPRSKQTSPCFSTT